MKLLILHLSDIHFKENRNYSDDNINALISVLRPSMIEIENVLIIVSGDLAFSGTKLQYISMRKFLTRIKNCINKTYHIDKIEFAIVPGNHDVDYMCGELRRADLEEIKDNDSYDSFVSQELKKQQEFFKLARMFGCFTEGELLHQKRFNVGNSRIQINLINTGVFSSLDEDQGFHYLSETELTALKEQNNSDFIFSVMHHPSAWFYSKIADRLDTTLHQNSDLIFVGHKHYETTRTVSDSQSSVNILAGGMLSDRGNWDTSELHVGVLNLDTRLFDTKKYQWDVAGKIYVEKDCRTIKLSKDRFDSNGFSILDQYLDNCIKTDQFLIADNFLDYFVFPLLEEQKDDKGETASKNIDNMENFIKRLQSSKKILISGLNDSGKTAFTKAVFVELSTTMTVLLIHGSDITGDPEKTIRNAFDEIYGRDSVKYERFRQADPNSLALIIDDVDAIDEASRDVFINYVNVRFGSILETCQQDIELDIQSRLKKKYDRKDYAIFRIEPFYSDKRRELITKVINIIGNDGQNKSSMITLLCDSLSKQKTLYNWSPSFIVQFTKYYYNNIGESSQNEGDVFGKVFENNLMSLIKPFVTKGITLDKIFIILDKIAYHIFEKHEYPISTTKICRIVEEYNDRYDSMVNAVTLLSVLVSSRVLKETDGGYLFYERSYLAYFTAREIRRLILDGNYKDIKYVMEYSYMNIHADILLFVTYITDNLNIIRMLMEMAERTLQSWDEFSLSPVNVEYMNQPAYLIIKPVEEGDREKEEQKHLEVEKEEKKALSLINDASLFDGESEELDFIQEMLRSISLMTTIARALPSFEHMMERADKDRCVKLLYTMPLKIFFVWAREVNESRSEIVHMIKEFHEWEYRKDKPGIEPFDDNKALMALRWESISLLLELMNAAFGYATKDNTWRFINRYDYMAKPTYGLEHLMGIEQMDDVAGFISEAVRLYNDNEAQTQYILQRISRHYMVNSKRIRYTDVQRLNSKLFKNQLKPAHLLVEQKINKQKK